MSNTSSNDVQQDSSENIEMTFVVISSIIKDIHKGYTLETLSYKSCDKEQLDKDMIEWLNHPDEDKRFEIIGMYNHPGDARMAYYNVLFGRIEPYTKALRDGTINFPNLSELNYDIYPYVYVTLFGNALIDYPNQTATIRNRVNDYLKLPDLLDHMDVSYRWPTDDELKCNFTREIHHLRFKCNPLLAMLKRPNGFTMTDALTGKKFPSACDIVETNTAQQSKEDDH